MLITLVFCVEVLILRETDGWKIGVKEGNLGPFPHYWLHWQFSTYQVVKLGVADLTVNNLLGELVRTLLLSNPSWLDQRPKTSLGCRFFKMIKPIKPKKVKQCLAKLIFWRNVYFLLSQLNEAQQLWAYLAYCTIN
jgi:hypothetical protein